MAFDPRTFLRRPARAASAVPRTPLPGERGETGQRLQVGLFGLGAMILIVGLASIIQTSAEESRAGAVPEAAPTVVASETPAPARDPLADAGVVPDLPPGPGTEGGGEGAPAEGAAAGAGAVPAQN